MTERGRAVFKPLLLLAGLLAAGYALRAIPSAQDGLGAWATAHDPVRFVLLGAVACAVGMPRQAVAFAAGYAYGVWAGFWLALAAELLGCVADLLWARAVARDWSRARLRGRWGLRLAALDRRLARQPFGATLALRLLPLGSNILLNLLAGVSTVRVAPFLLASALGYVPQTVVFGLLGAGARIDRTSQLVLGLALFVLSVALGLILLRRERGGEGSPKVSAG